MTTTMTSGAPPSCIGEPVSWLRLEQFAMSRRDTRVSEHLDACPACRACLDEISRDVVALPPLVVPAAAAKARRPWWHLAMPIGLAVAAAAILLLVLGPRAGDHAVTPTDVTQVKGLGTVEIDVVRNRGGVTRDDARTFIEGDRWKVIVTCAAEPGASVWVDVFVNEERGGVADHPFAPQEIACGNAVVLQGAFEITGTKPNLVCVRVSSEGLPPQLSGRNGEPGDPGVACVTLTPE
jgi:hypothetical protein